MKRDIGALSNREYDLIIVGGGMFGACAAWEAISRGLSVILLERGDFCQATSANHYKMVHGGIRYLQHWDLRRVRESCRERRALLRVAPHLVQPLPIVMPTYGHGKKGKEILSLGMFMYDVVTMDRNHGIADPMRKIPSGRTISRDEVLALFPYLTQPGLSGAAIFSDAQMYNPPRLVLSFIRSAVQAGADAVNYIEVQEYIRKDERIIGVKARDLIQNNDIIIRGKLTLNTTGPWAYRLLKNGADLTLDTKPAFSRDVALVLHRKFDLDFCLAINLESKDEDSLIDRGGRHIFFAPWLGRPFALLGVWHIVWGGSEDQVYVNEEELLEFLSEINKAYPALALTLNDISMVNTGLTLFSERETGSKRMRFGKRSILIDHAKAHSVDGLVTLIGVRATTARGAAEKAIDLIGQKLGKVIAISETQKKPIFGGEIENFEAFLCDHLHPGTVDIDGDVMRSMLHNYGTEFRRILHYIQEEPTWGDKVGNSSVLKAEIIHAIREEMALTLSDVVMRRTELGSAGYPGDKALKTCAELMGAELQWTQDKIQREIEATRSRYANFGAWKNYAL